MLYVIAANDDIRLKYLRLYGPFDTYEKASKFLDDNVELSYDDETQYDIIGIEDGQKLLDYNNSYEDEWDDDFRE